MKQQVSDLFSGSDFVEWSLLVEELGSLDWTEICLKPEIYHLCIRLTNQKAHVASSSLGFY